MKVLAFDPSGNYFEGKGTSGWSTSLDSKITKIGDIAAEGFNSREAYWLEHKKLIDKNSPDIIVIESYRLFGHKAKEQTGSSLETPMLIGYLQMVAYELNIPVVLQDPTIKSRFSDAIMLKLGWIEKRGNKYYFKGELTNMHKRDAIRHNIYYCRYGKK